MTSSAIIFIHLKGSQRKAELLVCLHKWRDWGQEVNQLPSRALCGRVRKLILGWLFSVMHISTGVTACPLGLHFKEKLNAFDDAKGLAATIIIMANSEASVNCWHCVSSRACLAS